ENATVLIDNQCNMNALFLEVFQQGVYLFVFRDKKRRPEEVLPFEMFILFGKREHVFNVKDALDMVDGITISGHPGVTRLINKIHQLMEVHFNIYRRNIDSRSHNLPHGKAGEIRYTFEDLLLT